MSSLSGGLRSSDGLCLGMPTALSCLSGDKIGFFRADYILIPVVIVAFYDFNKLIPEG